MPKAGHQNLLPMICLQSAQTWISFLLFFVYNKYGLSCLLKNNKNVVSASSPQPKGLVGLQFLHFRRLSPNHFILSSSFSIIYFCPELLLPLQPSIILSITVKNYFDWYNRRPTKLLLFKLLLQHRISIASTQLLFSLFRILVSEPYLHALNERFMNVFLVPRNTFQDGRRDIVLCSCTF